MRYEAIEGRRLEAKRRLEASAAQAQAAQAAAAPAAEEGAVRMKEDEPASAEALPRESSGDGAANPAAPTSNGAAGSAAQAAGSNPGGAEPFAEPPPPPRAWLREEFEEWLVQPEQASLQLDPDQRRVVDLACRRGRSIFYTGPGGVGKSHVRPTRPLEPCHTR